MQFNSFNELCDYIVNKTVLTHSYATHITWRVPRLAAAVSSSRKLTICDIVVNVLYNVQNKT